MKFLLNIEKALKSGLNLDYFFKIITFKTYKLCTGNNFLYLIDKYLAEKILFLFSSFLNYFSVLLNSLGRLNFNQIIKLFLIIVLQLLLIYFI
jgi:hypothetical protein